MHPSELSSKFPNKVALAMAETGETLTFKEWDDLSMRASQLFRSLGLERGDHVAILMENDIKLPIQLYTDSQYSIKTLTKWFPNWSEKDKKTKKNIPLITDTYKLVCDVKPELNYVKAHTGLDDEHSLGNAIADQLANDALDKFDKNNQGILKYFQYQ